MTRPCLVVRRPAFACVLSAAAFLSSVVPAAGADDHSAKSHVWGDSGPGQVATSTAQSTDPSSSSNSVLVQAIGCYAHAEGVAVTGAIAPDVDLKSSAVSHTSYQLSFLACSSCVCSWTATGAMKWQGKATVDTELDADSYTAAAAILGYSGDLTLRGACAVTAGTVAGSTETTWKIALSPSLTQKVTRTHHATEDSCAGGSNAQNAGPGPSVRVDVLAIAQEEIKIDTNCFGMGYGKAESVATNRGQLDLTISALCSSIGQGGDPTTGGSDTGGPTTPGGGPAGGGGGPSGNPTTPGRKVVRVTVTDGIGPEPVGDGPTASNEMPDPPKLVDGPTGDDGTDEGGNRWSSGGASQDDDK